MGQQFMSQLNIKYTTKHYAGQNILKAPIARKKLVFVHKKIMSLQLVARKKSARPRINYL